MQDIVVKYVLQPIADRVADRASPADLARMAIAPWMVFLVGAISTAKEHNMYLLAFLFVACAIYSMIFKAELAKAERAPLNTINPLLRDRMVFRQFLYFIVLTSFVVLVFRAFGIEVNERSPISILFGCLHDVSWVAMEGFAACTRKPPKRQEARIPASMATDRAK